MLLGDDLLPYLVLALGAALVIGNGMALVRPPKEAKQDELARAPLGRSVVMIAIGAVAAIWALASLATGSGPLRPGPGRRPRAARLRRRVGGARRRRRPVRPDA
jgi:hypothetical protein